MTVARIYRQPERAEDKERENCTDTAVYLCPSLQLREREGEKERERERDNPEPLTLKP